MCLPLAAAAGAVQAAGAVVSGLQGLAQGNYEAKVADRNAALENERARDSIMRGKDEARALFRRIGDVKGQQAAAMAANGIDLGYGSALRQQQDTAMLADEDARALYDNIDERTRGFDISASNMRAEGRAARFRGRSALINSAFQAGSSLMGGFQQQRALKAKMG